MTAKSDVHRVHLHRADEGVPVVSIGQGDFRRDYYAEDLGVDPANDKPIHAKPDVKLLEAEALGAALRYVVVADWFEQLPFSHLHPDRERHAMDAFNRVEAEFRQAGGRLLRRLGHRELVLKRALEEVAES
jgi:hypothetical protein